MSVLVNVGTDASSTYSGLVLLHVVIDIADDNRLVKVGINSSSIYIGFDLLSYVPSKDDDFRLLKIQKTDMLI